MENKHISKIKIIPGSAVCESCGKEIVYSNRAEPVTLLIGDTTVCLCEECLEKLDGNIRFYLGEYDD